MSSDQMVDEIRATKKLTSKPFGVDLLTALPAQMLENVELMIEEDVPVFVAALGVPREVIDRYRGHVEARETVATAAAFSALCAALGVPRRYGTET